MTVGKPMPLILSFCLPVMAGNIFQQFYNMMDSAIVGRFVGKGALAAVGSTGALFFCIIGFATGLCCGFSILISQRFGAGDMVGMRKYLANIIYLCTIISVVMTAAVILLTGPILRLMNTPEDIFKDAYTYIVIIFAGIPVSIFYNMLACVLRAVGNSKIPLYFLILSSALNIGLDLLFVLVFHMGVMGAAIATVASQLVSGILCFLYIRHNAVILFIGKENAAFSPSMCRELLMSGLPMALQFSITAIGSIMLQTAVNSLGSEIVATVTAAGKIQMILIQPSEAAGITMATYCGQNLGAGKLDRIRPGVRRALALSMGYCLAVGILVCFTGEKMALLFVRGSETEVLRLVGQYLRGAAPLYPILGPVFVYRNALQGIGGSMSAMGGGVFELVARGAFGMWIVPAYGFASVCYAHPAAWLAACIILIPAFYLKLRSEIKKVNTD